MASEEDILCVDSSYETIDVIDLTKESPKIRSLRSRLRQHNSSTLCSNRGSSLPYPRLSNLAPLTLGTQNTATKNSTRMRRRTRNVTMNSTVNLDDTEDGNEDNEMQINLTDNNDDHEDDHEDDEEPSYLKCPICFEQLSSKFKPTTTRCGHIFCAMCLEQLIRVSKKKKCPTCQSNITLKSCTRLYI